MEKKIYSAAKMETGEMPEIRNVMDEAKSQELKEDIKKVSEDAGEMKFSGLGDNTTSPLPETSLEMLEDRVLIFPDKAPDKIGSIILTDQAKEREKPNRGRIVAVGVGRYDRNGNLIPMNLKRGDVVLYGRYAGMEIDDPITGEKRKYLVMRPSDIICRDNRI